MANLEMVSTGLSQRPFNRHFDGSQLFSWAVRLNKQAYLNSLHLGEVVDLKSLYNSIYSGVIASALYAECDGVYSFTSIREGMRALYGRFAHSGNKSLKEASLVIKKQDNKVVKSYMKICKKWQQKELSSSKEEIDFSEDLDEVWYLIARSQKDLQKSIYHYIDSIASIL